MAEVELRDVVIASFSGGRSSAMMVHEALQKGRHIDHIIFCNTGMESPETYEFIKGCDERLFGGRLLMLERTAQAGVRQVDHESLDRNGQVFEDLVFEKFMMPSVMARTCTQHLKVRLKHQFAYEKYGKDIAITNMLGIRADEPRRVARGRASNEAYEARLAQGKRPYKWTDVVEYPLVERGIGRAEVLQFWADNPLGDYPLSFHPADPDVRLSNCVGCFYGNLAEMMRVCKDYPWFAERWASLERRVNDERIKAGTYKHTMFPEKRKFIENQLGRQPTERETKEFSLNLGYTWDQLLELHGLGGPKQKTINLVPVAGGCSDGECGTDLQVATG